MGKKKEIGDSRQQICEAITGELSHNSEMCRVWLAQQENTVYCGTPNVIPEG